MKRLVPILIVTTAIALTVACTQNPSQIVIPKNAAKLKVTFSWQGIKACTHDSPRIRVSGIPQGTRTLEVKLTNIDVPAWNQGGGRVANDGSGIIPAGALKIGYNGPCPPPGEQYQYEFSVMALDEHGAIIGFGKARQVFPPKG
jgi:phosphatidylethanolamine-binding protein (PEBP) family uncharacterized protein